MATKVIYFWQNVFSKISSVLVGHQPITNNSISNIRVELLIKNLHTLAFESVEMVSASWSPMLCIESIWHHLRAPPPKTLLGAVLPLLATLPEE